MRFFVACVIRSIVVIVALHGISIYYSSSEHTVGVDVGAILAASLLTMAIAFLWSGIDGYRKSFGRVALLWCAVALLSSIVVGITVDGWSGGALRPRVENIADVAPFFLILITPPSMLGAGVGSVIASLRKRSTRSDAQQRGPYQEI
ncbi:hypothetical protein [Dermatophilus congolensis]|uniref:Uncharacterized protein n=1 Tax=Dermatophilus congolensis TaxID=1863 RepID=A0AA46BNJ5_9MICO|nr:hypothetical protein [Dermatophilus congolensis]MBO3143061.1 hypothetical protein [Dermatophilus congolensis]MBO3152050.1 hypothetical protein [Dermatophilus congolensis]MBO3160938.1 hypothetical protein [Dermatophilus congolensis]MBO3163336.1 hypothetical protein [Dermatophilus congolensis]MBO3176889.1 hypothetical protein [Dermatophilus congolensis]